MAHPGAERLLSTEGGAPLDTAPGRGPEWGRVWGSAPEMESGGHPSACAG